MLLLLDQGFYSYELWLRPESTGVKLLARVSSPWSCGRSAPWPTARTWPRSTSNDFDGRMDREGILVRVIRYTRDDPQPVGHGEVHVLLTNLLDEKL
jgi:hypothetical protein